MKQLKYAEKMGLKFFHNTKSPYNIDMEGKSVLDIGGGPVSMLLKCENVKEGVVVDPCDYPDWVMGRYQIAGITFVKSRGEDITLPQVFDEVWIYNVLQHCEDVQKVIENAKKCSKVIRIFEWVDNGISLGHPNNLTELDLNKWLGGEGKVEWLNEFNLKGKCYHGIFRGDKYE
jgi:hypothetical protein